MVGERQTVAISGAGGLIGGALVAALAADGHCVLRLVRRPAATGDEVEWNPTVGIVSAERLGGVDAVIHLAGENIAARRWSRRRMDAIRHSRVAGTRALVAALSRLGTPPRSFLCASAIGIYGDRGTEVLREDSSPGQGFLAEVCQAWEHEAAAAASCGMRWVSLRFGVVLTPEGGMLKRILTPFRLGLGGRVGSGRQYVSWVSLVDVVGAVRHALSNADVAGPVNVVAPQPVTSREFARTLGRVLGRPAVLPAPALVLRLLFGRMADEALLASARAEPTVLLRTGYPFRHPQLEEALRAVLESAR